MSRKHRQDHTCLNCGKEVPEKFCTHCGQENLEPKESFRHIMSHFVTDYLHLDSKFFGSLKPLLFKPGFLTNEFNAGRRASYVHPFRLYIFISIIFFLVTFNLESTSDKKKKESYKKELTEITDSTKIHLDTIRNDTLTLTPYSLEIQDGWMVNANSDSTLEAYENRQASLPEFKRDGGFARYMNKKGIKSRESGESFAEKFKYTLKHNIPKMMFLLLPVFALLLRIFFRKKKLFYVEHFYHSVHLHSFAYLLMIILSIPEYFFPQLESTIEIIFWISILVYLYKSLMRVYEQNSALTLVKEILILILYGLALVIFTILNALISFIMV